MTALPNNGFLLATYSIVPDAQNGGLVRYWWLNPDVGPAKVVLEGRAGGGDYRTIAQNNHWLFWSRAVANAPSFQPLVKDATSALVDLRSGDVVRVSLGGSGFAVAATWTKDGHLHVTLAGAHNQQVLDPESLQLNRAR